ncbi:MULTISPECIES: signal peptidase II [Agrobacterium]|uniref:signal peptidase II n=1 Tax=Agrobacterium TaxID=357 RepID=UPI001574C46A|nr:MULTISPECIES: signal peptidase II [Agrobacterium]NTJ44166.1 signal peptidase II [Agrobacterium larrymoorei]WCK22486.1 signal peptidase II [Agrobacterium tumefaciens]
MDATTFRSRLLTVSTVVAVFCIFDLVVKYIIVACVMNPPKVIEVTPFFNLVLGYNPGVSFGIFAQNTDAGPYILAALQFLIVIGLIVWALKASKAVERFGLAMIAGGAVGNVIDRMKNRAVTDYLDFHAYGWSWPAFNMADVAIVCGAAIVVLDSHRSRDSSAA